MKIALRELGELSEKEQYLLDLARSFPDDYYCNSPIPLEYEMLLEDLIVDGRKFGWTDEFIRICEDNRGIQFCELLKLIVTEERYPLLEIVDEDVDVYEEAE